MVVNRMSRNYPHYDMQRMHYWYIVFVHEGRLVVWYLPDCYNEIQARRKAQSKLGNRQCQVISRPYRDITRVTNEMKAEMLDTTGNVDESLRRARHTEVEDRDNDKDDGLTGVPAKI